MILAFIFLTSTFSCAIFVFCCEVGQKKLTKFKEASDQQCLPNNLDTMRRNKDNKIGNQLHTDHSEYQSSKKSKWGNFYTKSLDSAPKERSIRQRRQDMPQIIWY